MAYRGAFGDAASRAARRADARVGGALRWLRSHAEPRIVREAAQRGQGPCHAVSRRRPLRRRFTPLEPVVMRLHRALKAAFDPAGILNPGRLYPEA